MTIKNPRARKIPGGDGGTIYPWEAGFCPNPHGRPRKFVSQIKGIGYTVSEVNDSLQNLMSMNHDEIKNIAEDKSCTILEQIVARSLINSHSKKNLGNVETLLTRAFGKPIEKIEQKNSGSQEISIKSTDPIEAAREYQELIK